MRMKKTPVTLGLLPRQALDILEEVDVTREEARALRQVILDGCDADAAVRMLQNPALISRLSRIHVLQGMGRVLMFGDTEQALLLLATIPGEKAFLHMRSELLRMVLRRSITWWIDPDRLSSDFFRHLQADEWEMMVNVVLRSRNREFADKLWAIFSYRTASTESQGCVHTDLATWMLKRLAKRE